MKLNSNWRELFKYFGPNLAFEKYVLKHELVCEGLCFDFVATNLSLSCCSRDVVVCNRQTVRTD